VSTRTVALRLSWRTARRQLGQSALVAGLIALPIAGLAGGAIVYWSMQATPEQQVLAQLGDAQARIQDAGVGSPVEQNVDGSSWGGSPVQGFSQPDVDTLLPANTRIIGLRDDVAQALVPTGLAELPVTIGTSWDKSFHGRLDVTAGRAPLDTTEALVTAPTLTRLGIGLGGTVTITQPVRQTLTVVGLMTDTRYPRAHQALYVPDGALGNGPAQSYYLPSAPLSWDQVEKFNAAGYVVFSREVVLHPPASPPVSSADGHLFTIVALLSTTGAFAALEVGILAGAAMLVGTKRQQRTLATLAATGTPRSALIAIISAQGVVLGLAGGLAGVSAGILGARAYLAATSDGSADRYPGFNVPWGIVIGVLAFAVAVGWAAALVPAVSASRFDVVAALRGSRVPQPVRRRGLVLGTVLTVAGAGLTLASGVALVAYSALEAQPSPPGYARLLGTAVQILLVAGPLAVLLGLILAMPLVMNAIARVIGRIGRSSLLAARDAARNRGRSIPAIATTLVAVFLAAFAMTAASNATATARDGYGYETMPAQLRVQQRVSPAAGPEMSQEQVLGAVRQSMPVSRAAVLSEPHRLNTFQYNAGKPMPVFSDTRMNVAVSVPAANGCPVNRSAARPGGMAYQTADGRIYSPLARDARCRDLALSPDESRGGADSRIVIGGADELRLLLHAEPSPAALAALAAGKAVSLHPLLVADGHILLEYRSDKQIMASSQSGTAVTPKETRTVEAVVDQPARLISGFAVVIPPDTAQRLGIEYEPAEVLAQLSRTPTDAERDALNGLLDVAGDGPVPVFEFGPSDPYAALGWGALGASAFIALAAAIVALGLARIEGRQDDATLAAVGASGRTRRAIAFWQAIILTGTGTVFGVATGLMAGFALALPGSGTEFAPPWVKLGLLGVALPALIALAMLAFVRGARFRPVARAAIA